MHADDGALGVQPARRERLHRPLILNRQLILRFVRLLRIELELELEGDLLRVAHEVAPRRVLAAQHHVRLARRVVDADAVKALVELQARVHRVH